MRPALRHALLSRPGWVSWGASSCWDFANSRYWRQSTVGLSIVSSFTRGSAGWAFDSTGEIVEFATDAARITDRGLTIEAAATNLATYADVFDNVAWDKNNVTVTQNGAWWEVRDVISSALHRRVNSTAGNAPITAGHTYAISAPVQPQNGRRYYCFRANIRAVASFENIAFDLNGDGSVTFAATGWTGYVTKIGSSYLLEAVTTATGTAASSGVFGLCAATAEVTDNTLPTYAAASTEFTHKLRYMQFEEGERASTFVETAAASATRAVDAAVLKLPSGTHDLTVTFDNLSTQVVSGQSGDYAVPTSLDRRVIGSVLGQRVSPF